MGRMLRPQAEMSAERVTAREEVYGRTAGLALPQKAESGSLGRQKPSLSKVRGRWSVRVARHPLVREARISPPHRE